MFVTAFHVASIDTTERGELLLPPGDGKSPDSTWPPITLPSKELKHFFITEEAKNP